MSLVLKNYPILYKKDKSDKVRIWKITASEHEDGSCWIETEYGQKEGKITYSEKQVKTGKNIGKKNETTAIQQAINEARSAWVKKKESGYTPVTDGIEEEDGVSVDSASGVERGKGIDDSVPLPMLAHDYNKRGSSIIFPCFVQRKFDGTRCVGIPGNGLFSRNRKRYPNLQHIVAEINRLPPGIILDGELYSDTLTFQEIVGIVKRETLKKGDDEKQLAIKFYVYDLINTMPYEERLANLQILFARHKFKYLELVKTDICESEAKMKELHAQYVAESFEGIMLRNKVGLYKNARSCDLQKFKQFFDDEFEIVDYKEGEGQEEGCVIWVCKTPESKTFSCRPRGSREDRIELFKNGDKYIGKMLTVRFQELTDEKMPRFPVGICVRNYE